MGKITAKVKLASRADSPYGGTALQFYADYADGRNKEWASATPNLSLAMTVRPDVAELFEVNAAYTLVFEKEEEDSSG